MKKVKLPQYPLMWLSDKYCPCVEDTGLGIGCLKVIGNTQFAIPLCPGVIALDKSKDPIRKAWLPHENSPTDPAIAPDPGLSLENRTWTPYCLESSFVYHNRKFTQQTTVFDYGAGVRITSEGTVKKFSLIGISYGPCKIYYNGTGLTIIEVSPKLRPLTYSIKFNHEPEVFVSGRCLNETPGKIECYANRTEWSFVWDKLSGDLEMEVNINRAGQTEAACHESFSSRLEQSRSNWENYYDECVPVFNTPDERLNKFCEYMAYVYRSNGIKRWGLLSHEYTMPKQTFTGWWMWDSCFHAIAGCWFKDKMLTWGSLLNIENIQYPPGTTGAGTVTNQAFPHGVDLFLSDDPMSPRIACMPHLLPEESGDGTHPPIFAQALFSVWSSDGNDLNMQRLLPDALAYHGWFERRRRSSVIPGLLIVKRWSDSGMDNSPRWGQYGSGIYNTGNTEAKWSLPVVTVDLNVLSVLEKLALAEMCNAVGMEDEAAELHHQARERSSLIHQTLWDGNAGFYMDRCESSGEFIPVMSPTGFYPLMLEDVAADRLSSMLEKLFDVNKFWTRFPVPSVAADDQCFRAEHSYWSGGVWMSYLVYILRGLFKYDPTAAWKLFDRILDGLMPMGIPNIFENYNPETGQGYDAVNFGWAGMLLDVIIRNMLDIRPEKDKLICGDPKCPDSWNDFEINNLPLREKTYNIHGSFRNGSWSCEKILKKV